MRKTLLVFLSLVSIYNFVFSQEVFLKKKKEKFFFVNEKGKKISRNKFQDAKLFLPNAKLTAVKIGNKWGYVNRKIDLVIPCKFDEAYPFNHSKFGIVKQNNQFYFISIDGEIISSPYDSLAYFHDMFIAEKSGLFGIVDNSDNLIIPFDFEKIQKNYKGDFQVKKENSWGEFDLTNSQFIIYSDKKVYEENELDALPIYSEKCIDHQSVEDIIKCDRSRYVRAIYEKIKWPKKRKGEEVEGKVIVEFVINEAGEVESPKVIQSLEEKYDNEVLKVVNNHVNLWAKAAEKNGNLVKSKFVLPIKFYSN